MMFEVIYRGKVVFETDSFDEAMDYCFDSGLDPDEYLYAT